MEEEINAALSLWYSPPLSVPRSFGLPQLQGGVRRGPKDADSSPMSPEARNTLKAVTTSQARSEEANEASDMDGSLV